MTAAHTVMRPVTLPRPERARSACVRPYRAQRAPIRGSQPGNLTIRAPSTDPGREPGEFGNWNGRREVEEG